MGMSIYYTARRNSPLTPEEQAAIVRLVDTYSVDEQIEERERTRKGPNWSSFVVYDAATPSEPDVIFEGATQLPSNSLKNCWIGVQHWCKLLSEIRCAVPDSVWYVSVDDHQIHWNDTMQEFDP